jgi:hypothetical protein
MNAQEIVQLVRDAGVTGLLIFALIGGFRMWWVFGWHYRAVVKERDEWKALALGGTHLAERTIEAAKDVMS